MLSSMNVSPNFASTRITLKPNEMDKPCFEVLDKYLNPVKERYVLREGWYGKNITPQFIADDIRLGEAAYTSVKNEINVFGKDKASDFAIGKLLTKLFPENATFTENIK